MDRQIVYPGAIPLESDLLNTNKNTMVALGKLAGAIFGSNTYVNGLTVGANSPAALNVVVQPGEIYSLQNIDGSAYSSLAADTAHQIVKQGILLDAVTLPTPAPGSAGQSINYLIQASFSEVDGGATVLPFYNSSNPAQAYSGPSNSGATSYTKRQGTVLLSAKAGVAATTGSQTTPAPDSGYVGLAVVTVAYGSTSVTGPNIAALGGSPYQPTSAFAQALFGGRKQVFTGNGSFTVPAGVTQIWVSGCAGGGGGGGGGDNSAGQSSNVGGGGGGGGGAGQSLQRYAFAVTPGQSIAITIGGGGSGGAGGAGSNASAGGAGGNTVIGSLVTLNGGSGGGYGLRPTANAIGSGGAAGAGGAGYPYGGFGVDGNYAGNGGQGASSPFGGGGGAGRAGTGAGIAGNGAAGYGSGGGGGGAGYASASQANGAAGGPGAPGIVVIEF